MEASPWCAPGARNVRRGRFARPRGELPLLLRVGVAGRDPPGAAGRRDVPDRPADPRPRGAARWARRWRVPFVFLCQDVFPEVATLLEDFRSERVNRALDRVNRLLLAAPTPSSRSARRWRSASSRKGADPARVTVIHNWADRAILGPGPKKNPFAEAHGLARPVRRAPLRESRTRARDSEHLVDAAALLRDLPDLMLVFQGDGVKRHALEAQARALGLENVRFPPLRVAGGAARRASPRPTLQVVSLRRGLAGFIVPQQAVRDPGVGEGVRRGGRADQRDSPSDRTVRIGALSSPPRGADALAGWDPPAVSTTPRCASASRRTAPRPPLRHRSAGRSGRVRPRPPLGGQEARPGAAAAPAPSARWTSCWPGTGLLASAAALGRDRDRGEAGGRRSPCSSGTGAWAAAAGSSAS